MNNYIIHYYKNNVLNYSSIEAVDIQVAIEICVGLNQIEPKNILLAFAYQP